MHKQHILPSFSDDSSADSIEALTQQITISFQSIQHKIKRISHFKGFYYSDYLLKATSNNEDDLMSKNVMISLASKLQDLSQRFRQSQQSYLKKMRDRQTVQFGVPIIDAAITSDTSTGLMDLGTFILV
jgi:syntaxin 16